MKKNKKSLACQASLLGFFSSSADDHVSPSVMLEVGNDDPDYLPTIQKCPILKLSFVCHFIVYVIFFFLNENVAGIRTTNGITAVNYSILLTALCFLNYQLYWSTIRGTQWCS
jgi:hypothetical protein